MDTKSRTETTSKPSEPFTVPDEIAGQRGVLQTPQGWWALGPAIVAILIAVALWLRYH